MCLQGMLDLIEKVTRGINNYVFMFCVLPFYLTKVCNILLSVLVIIGKLRKIRFI